jgi:hypothetical protein
MVCVAVASLPSSCPGPVQRNEQFARQGWSPQTLVYTSPNCYDHKSLGENGCLGQKKIKISKKSAKKELKK